MKAQEAHEGDEIIKRMGDHRRQQVTNPEPQQAQICADEGCDGGVTPRNQDRVVSRDFPFFSFRKPRRGADPNWSAFLELGYSCPVCLSSKRKICSPKLGTRRACTSSTSGVCCEPGGPLRGARLGNHSGPVCVERPHGRGICHGWFGGARLGEPNRGRASIWLLGAHGAAASAPLRGGRISCTGTY